MHHGSAARMAVATPRAAASASSSGDALQRAEDLGSVGKRHTASSARNHAVPHPATVGRRTRHRGLVVSTDTTPSATRTPRSWRCSGHRGALVDRTVRPVVHRVVTPLVDHCGVTGLRAPRALAQRAPGRRP